MFVDFVDSMCGCGVELTHEFLHKSLMYSGFYVWMWCGAYKRAHLYGALHRIYNRVLQKYGIGLFCRLYIRLLCKIFVKKKTLYCGFYM